MLQLVAAAPVLFVPLLSMQQVQVWMELTLIMLLPKALLVILLAGQVLISHAKSRQVMITHHNAP